MTKTRKIKIEEGKKEEEGGKEIRDNKKSAKCYELHAITSEKIKSEIYSIAKN